MENEIYIVICKNKNIADFTGVNVSQECYKTKEQAIAFCISRMNEEEIEKYEKALARGLISWYEFDTKNYIYTIKVLNLK